MQDPRASTKKVGTITISATTVANATAEDAGSSTARAATLSTKSVARNRGIYKRNASAASGGTIKSTTETILEESGHTRSAHSSSTAGARGWNSSQLLRIARSAPPNRAKVDAHRCSRGSNTHLHLHRARRHSGGTHKRNPTGSVRKATSCGGARMVSPNHRRGGSNICVAWNKPKKITFGY